MSARRARRYTLTLVGLLLVAGCGSLPDVSANQCGNGVIELHEDCDVPQPSADATTGPICLPRGTAGQCHFDCRRPSSGVAPPCPAGWGCNIDGLCRPPTGKFRRPVEYNLGTAWSVASGDFDGDGRADVLSRGPVDTLGRAKMTFHHFDSSGALLDSKLFPKAVASPVITDLSGDGRGDIVFSDLGGVGVMLGRSDRRWVPESFSSYHLPATSIRMIGIYDQSIEDIAPIVVMGALDGKTGFINLDPKTGVLQLQGQVPRPIEALAGDPQSGILLEDPKTSPCWEVVFAFRGDTTFTVADVCSRSPTTTQITFRNPVMQMTVPLDPPLPIVSGPLLADLNADGHLDVLVEAGAAKVYVSYGDGAKLAPAVPYVLTVAGDNPLGTPIPTPMGLETMIDISMPLDVGDFTGDGRVDFVFPTYLLLSAPTPGNNAVPTYAFAHANFSSTPWTEAKIADFNGDGAADVVVASAGSVDLAFFNGSGSPNLTAFSIPTSRPVGHLAVGDFDGDRINDLALVVRAAPGETREALGIAFGNVAGPPSPPALIADVRPAEALGAFRQDGMGTVFVSSSETVGSQARGLLTILDGSGDRLPYAPHTLSDALVTGSIASSIPLRVALGGFTAAKHGDAIALAARVVGGLLSNDGWQVWLLPAVATSDAAAVNLEWTPDPRLQPLSSGQNTAGVPAVVGGSADVDNDDRDEALWAMPADDGKNCGVLVLSTAAGGSPRAVARDTIFLEEPCTNAQLMPVDADGDGWIDIALLTGATGVQSRRKLLVLWNDRQGHFSDKAIALVTGDDVAEAFTVLRAADRPARFVYVSQGELVLVDLPDGKRVFGTRSTVLSLEGGGGSGVVAADVNGDQLMDLVVAVSGNLRVLNAELEPL